MPSSDTFARIHDLPAGERDAYARVMAPEGLAAHLTLLLDGEYADLEQVNMNIDCVGDDAFDVHVNPSGRHLLADDHVAPMLLTFSRFDAARVRACVAWLRALVRDRALAAPQTFAHRWSAWPRWKELSYVDRARALQALLPDAKPLELRVARGEPITERGEPPMFGLASVELVYDLGDGWHVKLWVDGSPTVPEDWARLGARLAELGAELAASLGISVVVA